MAMRTRRRPDEDEAPSTGLKQLFRSPELSRRCHFKHLDRGCGRAGILRIRLTTGILRIGCLLRPRSIGGFGDKPARAVSLHSLCIAALFVDALSREMPNSFATNIPSMTLSGWGTVLLFAVLAVLVVVIYMLWLPVSGPAPVCPVRLTQHLDGSLTLSPQDMKFANMNEFQQWFHSSGKDLVCPLPILDGAKEIDVPVAGRGWSNEQTYAKTPIDKVDDYEFSRIFGFEKGGRMIVPRQNFNLILNDRTFDWADLPLSAEERRGKYKGLEEGFSAAGELRSMDVGGETNRKETLAAVAAANQDWDPKMRAEQQEAYEQYARDEEESCPSAKERKEIQRLADNAYGNDPAFEPVVSKVGPNHWEITELRPKRRHVTFSNDVDNRVVNTDDDSVDVEFRYRGEHTSFGPADLAMARREDVGAALDPAVVGELPWGSERLGDVLGPMMRPYGPTQDHKSWDYINLDS